MAEYNVNIVNGVATVDLPAGSYTVSAVTVNGYKLDTLNPTSLTVTAAAATDFEIAADGTLTVHVTEDGTSGGTVVAGSKFQRCDKNGNTVGTEQTTDLSGNVSFSNTPYGDLTSKIYLKNTQAAIGHVLLDDILEFIPTTQTQTCELAEPLVYTQTINLTDENYVGLNIENATIKIEDAI